MLYMHGTRLRYVTYAKRDYMPYLSKMSCIQYQIAQLMLISMEHFTLV